MFSIQFLFRFAKIVVVASIGLMSLLVVVGNTTDYFTNYVFVEHVMKMDTIFPDSHLLYRSINSNYIFHAGYILIILLESVMAICCIKGTWMLAKNIKSSPDVFHANKNWAVSGLIIGIIIWFLGFEVIGGEWFAMWQSKIWNGLAAAERIVSFLVLALILLHLKENE